MSHGLQQQLDEAFRRIEVLENLVKKLTQNNAPTVPIYDWDNRPQDAIEGQIAIMENAPDLTI